MYKNKPSHFIGLVICFGDLFISLTLLLNTAEMENQVNSFIALLFRAGLEDTHTFTEDCIVE